MSDEVIGFDDSPHAWLSHTGVKPEDAAAVELVQILSFQGDGAWVRFLQRPELVKWKVYMPRERIVSITMRDEAWPGEDVWSA